MFLVLIWIHSITCIIADNLQSVLFVHLCFECNQKCFEFPIAIIALKGDIFKFLTALSVFQIGDIISLEYSHHCFALYIYTHIFIYMTSIHVPDFSNCKCTAIFIDQTIALCFSKYRIICMQCRAYFRQGLQLHKTH